MVGPSSVGGLPRSLPRGMSRASSAGSRSRRTRHQRAISRSTIVNSCSRPCQKRWLVAPREYLQNHVLHTPLRWRQIPQAPPASSR
jgi:hypothetical protein